MGNANGAAASAASPVPIDTSFTTAFAAELDAIEARRRALGLRAGALPRRSGSAEVTRGRAWDLRLLGLAFSGGGIRSATFNLGVLQTLARYGLLKHVDYLSTVSGGGYIGSWFAALAQRTFCGARETPFTRSSYEAFERSLAGEDGVEGEAESGSPRGAIAYLRRFSNYLTPKLGVFSGDTWALISTYVRNALLNQVMFVLALAAAMLAARLLPPLLALAGDAGGLLLAGEADTRVPYIVLVVTLSSLAVGVINLGRNLAAVDDPDAGAVYSTGAVAAWILAPLLVIGLTLPSWLPSASRLVDALAADGGSAFLYAGLIGAVVSASAWLAICAFGWRDSLRRVWAWVLGTSLVSGAVLGIGMYFAGHLLAATGYAGAQLVLAPPLLALGVLTAGVLHIGLVGKELRGEYHEWLSRVGGLACIGALGWLVFTGLVLYGPLLVDVLLESVAVASTAGLAWIATTVAGLMLGRGQSGSGSGRATRAIVAVAPWVFIVGLVVAVAAGTQAALHALHDSAAAYMSYERALDWFVATLFAGGGASLSVAAGSLVSSYHAWLGATADPAVVLGALGVAGVTFAVLALRIDINDFSLHNMYANRLTRCYLGASVAGRTGNAFSGFSRKDDLGLAVETFERGGVGLLRHVEPDRRERPKAGVPSGAYPGPFPIINTAINLVAGKNLAWQERKAASFVLTPLFSGYERSAAANDRRADAYRPTSLFSSEPRALTLGESVATSGAAASPNMGYHTSPAFAFLMGVFNVRLGRWTGNPQADRWRRSGPRFAGWHLFREMFGLTDSASRYVYLSDGGHFENLGIYELVRRRCRYVIACDGGADPAYAFEDLANAIRKCRIDLGVEIEIDTKEIARTANGFNVAPCAIGRIRYSEHEFGTLLYVKASRLAHATADVANYALRHPEFPHETTADQFFSESQFESYRRLGRVLSEWILDGATHDPSLDAEAPDYIDALFQLLREEWHPSSSIVAANFSRLTAACERIFDQLRAPGTNLSFLSAQFYPEWRSLLEDKVAATTAEAAEPWVLPTNPVELREGFYFCNSLIQLMENVYIDLDLEAQWRHPDVSGWINLFKHWTWSPMFRVTWAISAATYGQRFRTFCRQRLGLELGRVAVMEVPIAGAVDSRFDGTGFNLLERDHLNRLLDDVSSAMPGASPKAFELRLHVDQPVPGAGQSELRAFVFGYALVANDELVMFRVQDHLRQMSLGRWALTELLRVHGPVLELGSEARVLERLELIGEAGSRSQFRDFRALLALLRERSA